MSLPRTSWKTTETGAKLYISSEDFTKLIVLGGPYLRLQLTNLVLSGRISKIDNVCLRKIINRIRILNYRFIAR